MLVNSLQFTVMTFLTLGLFVATAVAFVDAILRKEQVFEAAGKLTKNGWLLILGLCAGMEILLGGIGLFIGAVATIVYFVDVRPAVASLSRRR